ncbi:MAG: hypothetical protein U0169_08095 [Polyangiaceae bacterium]
MALKSMSPMTCAPAGVGCVRSPFASCGFDRNQRPMVPAPPMAVYESQNAAPPAKATLRWQFTSFAMMGRARIVPSLVFSARSRGETTSTDACGAAVFTFARTDANAFS